MPNFFFEGMMEYLIGLFFSDYKAFESYETSDHTLLMSLLVFLQHLMKQKQCIVALYSVDTSYLFDHHYKDRH